MMIFNRFFVRVKEKCVILWPKGPRCWLFETIKSIEITISLLRVRREARATVSM